MDTWLFGWAFRWRDLDHNGLNMSLFLSCKARNAYLYSINTLTGCYGQFKRVSCRCSGMVGQYQDKLRIYKQVLKLREAVR
jgi:putative lipase involved disintegration of autophagic bodies